MTKITKRNAFGLVLTVIGAGAIVAASAAPVFADPVPSGFRDIKVVGSNTDQGLFDGASNGFTLGSASFTPTDPLSDIASYDAVDPTDPTSSPQNIQTRDGGPVFTRPNGSGDGVKALSAAWDPANHTWDGVTLSSADITAARSSSAGPVAYDGTSDLTYIPFARDAVGVVTKGLNISNFTTDELEAIYGTGDHTDGTYTQVAGTVTVGDIQISGSGTSQEEFYVTDPTTTPVTRVQVVAAVPQSGSGTRNFFLNAIGSTGSFGAWVQDNGGEENDAASVPDNGIFPFSGASLIEQENTLITSTLTGLTGIAFPEVNGETLVTSVDKNAAPGTLYGDPTIEPSYTLGNGSFDRDVYTVVPTSQLNHSIDGSTLENTFDNILPQSKDTSGHFIVADYGFESEVLGYTQSSANWFQNTFQH